MAMTIKKMDEIHNAIYDGSIDFQMLNTEEQSFAIGVVISAGNREVFNKNHFSKKQLDFLNQARKSLAK
jgi:hypothetical protein